MKKESHKATKPLKKEKNLDDFVPEKEVELLKVIFSPLILSSSR
jgi:hypothetical protein